MADDLGWADVSYHGSEIKTPNIDWLAQKGVRLEQHYVQPMCTPTRVALLTGRYPSRYGRHATTPCNTQVLPFGTVTLASALKSVGYDTAITGKWHLGSKPKWGPLQFGFNHSYGSLAGGVGQYNHRYKKGSYSVTWHRDDKLIEEQGHSTDLIIREAIRNIEEAGRNRLFLYVPFTAVHVPVEAPQEWVDFYKGKIEDESYRYYAAYTTHMDDGIGRIIEALRCTGRLDNTLIVFTSDNGSFPSWTPSGKYPGKYRKMECLGSNLPYRGYKAQLYEGGIRTPTVVYWRGMLEGGWIIDAPLHIVDWMPTFCNIAGYLPSKDLKWDGRDILPVLTGKDAAAGQPRIFYWKFKDRQAIRSGDWKLIVRPDKPDELYNIDRDPYEKENAARQKPELVARLKILLLQQASLDSRTREVLSLE
jgi:arylsulfatase A-like enzyme